MAAVWDWARRWGMEGVLATLAGLVFLGFLGTVDLWGKREQRASVEAIDTVDHQHWLVAEIQGRPRLEKPPLPRWTIAALITLTGRRDEGVVRLPSALAALGMVGLVYALGCRLGGRAVGLSAGLVLTSSGFFVSELRQAGNDGPLAFFVTLALYAAWRRLDVEADAGRLSRGRVWNLVFFAALGLGFLTKGPVVVLLVAVALVPYLVAAGRLRDGWALLADRWGLVVFLLLALSWPLPVLIHDPNAARVWYLEMGQKVGTAGVVHHRDHRVLAVEWPWMTAPWVVLASTAAALPFLPRGRTYRPRIWFPWFWTIGNLAMFCLWPVAKPNYYLPCLPGAALLVGLEWVRLTSAARASRVDGRMARRVLQWHWVVPFVVAVAAPVVVRQAAPQHTHWFAVLSVAVVAAVIASALAWRRGASAGALAPLVGAWTVGVLILYGVVAPSGNATRSHRALAATLDRLLPSEAPTVMFFQELDEGLWFYLRNRSLVPVPGSQPRYNKGFDLEHSYRTGQLELDPVKRLEAEKQSLREWLAHPDGLSPYVLIRKKTYDRFAAAIGDLAAPIYAEQGLERNEMVLLRATATDRVATIPEAGGRR